LRWSNKRAVEAQNSANKCAYPYTHCVIDDHSPPASENWSSYETPQGAVDQWYSEIKDYDYDNPENNGLRGKLTDTGHFIALVDENITEVGCASNSKGSWCVYTGQKSIYGVVKSAVEYDPNKGYWVARREVCSGMGDDILWNHVWGYTGEWIMNGAEFNHKVDIGWKWPPWEIVGTGDFDEDYKTDILLRNTKTGSNFVTYSDRVFLIFVR